MDNLTASNPVAHRVRVYYTGSDKIKEGEPLCYSFKTTRNWWGGSVSDEGVVTASDFAVEGTQNASKYMCVESPFRASTTTATSTAGSNVFTDNGAEFDNLHVGMAVSIASSNGVVSDGNYVITAVSAANNTITLDMTAAQKAAVTVQTDITVKIDNISAFAGVVAKGGWVGKTGPMVLDIYVPNGAVVPVRNDQNCTLGRTILAVHTNEQHLTAPHASDAYPVAIAWETVDTATTTGLVLAKLDPNIFVHQMGDNGGLIVDDEETSSSITINKMEITFNGSSLYNRALYYIANLDGGGAGLNGVFKFRTYVNSTMTNKAQCLCANLHVKDDGLLQSSDAESGEYNSAVYATVETETTTTQSDFSGTVICAYQACYYIDETTGAPDDAYVIGVPQGLSSGTYNWDGLLVCNTAASIGMVSNTDTPQYGIPIRVGTTQYWIMVSAATS